MKKDPRESMLVVWAWLPAKTVGRGAPTHTVCLREALGAVIGRLIRCEDAEPASFTVWRSTDIKVVETTTWDIVEEE